MHQSDLMQCRYQLIKLDLVDEIDIPVCIFLNKNAKKSQLLNYISFLLGDSSFSGMRKLSAGVQMIRTAGILNDILVKMLNV